jgi:hypothetical protein
MPKHTSRFFGRRVGKREPRIVDVESPATQTFITANAAALLRTHNVENIDASSVRGPSRPLTRRIASWNYEQTGERDAFEYGGISYASRLGEYK